MTKDHRRSEELATRARARFPGGVNSVLPGTTRLMRL
jgi:hypothetical protein